MTSTNHLRVVILLRLKVLLRFACVLGEETLCLGSTNVCERKVRKDCSDDEEFRLCKCWNIQLGRKFYLKRGQCDDDNPLDNKLQWNVLPCPSPKQSQTSINQHKIKQHQHKSSPQMWVRLGKLKKSSHLHWSQSHLHFLSDEFSLRLIFFGSLAVVVITFFICAICKNYLQNFSLHHSEGFCLDVDTHHTTSSLPGESLANFLRFHPFHGPFFLCIIEKLFFPPQRRWRKFLGLLHVRINSCFAF